MRNAKVEARRFANWFKCPATRLSPGCLAYLGRADTRMRLATSVEREEYVIRYLDLIRSRRIVRDEVQNRCAWEKGWSRNLRCLRQGNPVELAVKPGYFRGSKFLRLEDDLMVSPNPNIEFDLFIAVRHYLFAHYLTPYDSIVEIGCGSGQNLWMLAQLFPDKQIYGWDWVNSSVVLANALGRRCGGRIKGVKFDMLHPDPAIQLPPECAVITIHAMEQIGGQYQALLRYLLSASPARVLHYEPVMDFYNPLRLLDYLALWYCSRRQYLHGYWPALQRLSKAKRIQILSGFRPYVGGELHEASLIVWEPCV